MTRSVEELCLELDVVEAAWALGWISAEAEAAVPGLANALNDPDVRVRRVAAWALGRIGPEAKAAVPDLTKALQDPDVVMREMATWALGQINAGAKAAVPEHNPDATADPGRG